uniref:Cdc23 domain-containing protein n=1 Tax=Cannabis sativa TaxID=3483 RepID=A0A803P692_CANSA
MRSRICVSSGFRDLLTGIASWTCSVNQFRFFKAKECSFVTFCRAAEQLVGIELDPAKFTPANTRFHRGSSSIRRRFRTDDITSTPAASVSYVSTPVMEEDEIVDGDFYLLAKSYFDCREYKRAAHVLRDQSGKKSVFLRCYALYLAGEKLKEEEMIELEGPLGKTSALNRELVSLERELSTFRKNGTIDPFGLYLYGIVLKEKGSENLARSVLVESVNNYPWNWDAWSKLQSLSWTLMGHEFVEMKNTPAAVDAYRRAIDINSCDYRAWYGLGQAYEMMGMRFYALHYFKKSVFLQRMILDCGSPWLSAMKLTSFTCFEEAIKCYKRAVNCNDREAIALRQLAKLHHELGRSEEAAFYYKKDLERMEDEEREGPNMVEALLFLATHYRNVKRFEEAEVYCTRLLDYTGPEKETAKSLLRGMRITQSSFPSTDVEHFPP